MGAASCGRTTVGARLGRFVRAGLALATLAAGPVLLAAPATAQTPAPVASIGIRLLDVPVAARDDSRARIYIVDHLNPGTTIERRVEVSNGGDAAEHVVLYAAAARIKGDSFVGSAGHTANELSSWSSVTPAEADVAPGGTTTATVVIKVPSDAAPGEQYGVIWAEERSATAPATGTGGGVVEVSRVGIRLYVSVGPGGPPAADFAIDAMTAGRSPDGAPMVSAQVHNTGGRALDMSGTMSLASGPGGLRAGPFRAQLGSTLAPGSSQPVTIHLADSVPAGPWTAKVTLESGLTERSASARIKFPSSGQAAPVAVTESGSPPWAIIGAGITVALVLLLLATWWALRRRRAV